jgi:hypothetical protein
MTRVGWVGLGAMGLPMARCVARAGYKMAAYDIDPGRAASLAADGVKPAASISVVASGADVLVLMVATPGQVEDVLFGADPAAAALAPGTVVLVMATVGPAAVQHWAGRLAEQVVVVDAPVSGGVARAAGGDLLVMVGGPQTAVERVQPLLDAMASSTPVVGSAPGDGRGEMGGSGVQLAASQVIERPPAEVFRFVATDHFQNHPKWDPAVTSITQTSRGRWGWERPPGWCGPTGPDAPRAPWRSPSTSRSAASPRCPGSARSRCTPGRRWRPSLRPAPDWSW